MTINFNDIPESHIDHFKGGEGFIDTRMYFDGTNRIMRGRLQPGNTIGMHTHEDSCEIIYVLSGAVHMIYDGADEIVVPGQIHYCPKGHTHMMMNDGPEEAVFYAVVPAQ